MPPFQTHPSGTQHSLFREAANWLRPIPKVNFSKDTPRVAIWRQHFKTKNKGHVEGIIGYEYLGYLFFLSTLKLKESWLGIFPPENKGHGNQASSDSTIDHTNHLLGFKNHLLGFNKKTPEKTCGAGSFSFLVLTTDTRNPALLGFPPTRQTACHDP